MRRLSIIDLAGGHQPIANEDRSVWAVCNGEIYNFRQSFVRNCESRAINFSTESDSEIIVHLYEEYGDDFVTRLNGMFGLCRSGTLAADSACCLGRDRLGIKPVYYHAGPTGVSYLPRRQRRFCVCPESAPRPCTGSPAMNI